MTLNMLPEFLQFTFKYIIWGTLTQKFTQNKLEERRIIAFTLVLSSISVFLNLASISASFLTPIFDILLILLR